MRRADNLPTFMCRLPWNLGASTSWNPQGLSRPLMRWLYHLRCGELTVSLSTLHLKDHDLRYLSKWKQFWSSQNSVSIWHNFREIALCMLCVNITEDYFSEEFCEMIRDIRKQRALLFFIVLSFSSIRIFKI